MASTRRAFLEGLAAVAGSTVLTPVSALFARADGWTQDVAPSPDVNEFLKRIRKAEQGAWAAKPIGDLVAEVGLSFLGFPYVAHSLEQPGEEQLVINLQAFDCMTFVENVLALSRCIKRGTKNFPDFSLQLQTIRYRGGVIDGYPSRLHYSTDWVGDNQKKGIVRDVTKELGGLRYMKTINYMSTHADSYRQLSNRSYLRLIKAAETRLSAQRKHFLPKKRLQVLHTGLSNGDVIGITTSIKGIDIAHMGVVVESDGVTKFLHAPLSGGMVEVSAGSLGEYLEAHPSHTGIVVARPLEPGR